MSDSDVKVTADDFAERGLAAPMRESQTPDNVVELAADIHVDQSKLEVLVGGKSPEAAPPTPPKSFTPNLDELSEITGRLSAPFPQTGPIQFQVFPPLMVQFLQQQVSRTYNMRTRRVCAGLLAAMVDHLTRALMEVDRRRGEKLAAAAAESQGDDS